MHIDVNADKEVTSLMDELEGLLKNQDLGAVLIARGINTSLALLIAQGLRAYLAGEKRQAAEDLATAAEEISSRLAVTGDGSPQANRPQTH